MDIPEISPTELARGLAEGSVWLIDVREAWEIRKAGIPGAVHVPMQAVPGQIERIRADSNGRDVVVMCRSGHRSLTIAGVLQQAGLGPVFNLAGGILAWSEQVDPSVPRY